MGIYTRRGDGGETDLGNGERTEKFSLRVEAYGTLDELSACLGMARAAASGMEPPEQFPHRKKSDQAEKTAAAGVLNLSERLLEIQNQLSALAGWLSIPGSPFPLGIAGGEIVARLEAEIDAMMRAAGPLRGFIMPGKNFLEASLHLARTVCRRAERRLAELAAVEAGQSNNYPSSAALKEGRDDGSDGLPAVSPSCREDMAHGIKYLNRLSDWLFAASRI